MAYFNVIFATLTGVKMDAGRCPSDIGLADFQNFIRDKWGGLSVNRLIINGKQIYQGLSESCFKEMRKSFTGLCVIYVVPDFKGGCFLPNTVITRVDKTEVPIDKIKPGDDLLAFTSKGDIVTTIVQEVFVRDVDEYVELRIGQDKVVSVTSDHWLYQGNESFVQLKSLGMNDSLFILSDVGDELTNEPITALKYVGAPSTRVYNLHTTDPHTYFANNIAVHNMSGNMGVPFVDVGNEAGIQRIEFSATAPAWRLVAPGLCLEGRCLNASCAAHQQQVIMNIGYTKFDVLTDATAEKSRCPVCLKYVEPTTCGFSSCLWRWWGIKKPGSGLPPVEIPPCHWKEVDERSYDHFDQERSGSVIWLKLILEASSMLRHHG